MAVTATDFLSWAAAGAASMAARAHAPSIATVFLVSSMMSSFVCSTQSAARTDGAPAPPHASARPAAKRLIVYPRGLPRCTQAYPVRRVPARCPAASAPAGAGDDVPEAAAAAGPAVALERHLPADGASQQRASPAPRRQAIGRFHVLGPGQQLVG